MAALEQVLADAQRNGRVCPQPQRWQQLYELLPNKRRAGGAWEPALPLILAAWWETPDLSKMARLREHLEWADTHSCLEEVSDFLANLAEDEWHHLGN